MLTMSEVAKHNTKEDAWIVVNGVVLDVTKWIKVHPGGEQAIKQYMGKDASEEWNTIHKPGTVEKYATTDTGPKILGPVKGGGGAVAAAPARKGREDPPPIEGDGGIAGWPGAVLYLIKSIITMLLKTIFFTGNFIFEFDNERTGTIRSAIMLLVFTIVHVLGNCFDFWVGGPGEVNGETYFFERQQDLWWGFKAVGAGPIEIYLAMAFCLHVSVALKRSWDISMGYCLYTGKWNMMISGLVVLTFLMKHLQDFKWYKGYSYTEIPAAPMMVNPYVALDGKLWEEPGSPEVVVKDAYSREFVVFRDPLNVVFYLVAVAVFVYHMTMGWAKVLTADAMQIPKDHQTKVKYIGWGMALCIGLMYASLPVGAFTMKEIPVHHVHHVK